MCVCVCVVCEACWFAIGDRGIQTPESAKIENNIRKWKSLATTETDIKLYNSND